MFAIYPIMNKVSLYYLIPMLVGDGYKDAFIKSLLMLDRVARKSDRLGAPV